jgi:glycosyltransferase involved in cell wall biosynthesis
MRIGVVAPPFIPVPPVKYGGTELFVANLVRGLHARGHDVTVYTTGDSRVECQLKWRYARGDWPVSDATAAQLKNADHTAWAIHDAGRSVDVLHLNDAVGVPLTRFVNIPAVVTLHHAFEPAFSELYSKYPLDYVAISRSQARREPMPKIHVVPHGLPLEDYTFRVKKDDYVAFLGRMAPYKGADIAIAAARRAGIRLKLAGEVQPCFREYWERQVLPYVDGRQIEYIGEADRSCKNELLSRARALLFPIAWDEPFGLVMIESMACGTPVLAFPYGSVPEVVCDGASGWICRDVDELADRAVAPGIPAESCRDWVAAHFSSERMVDRYLEIYRRVLTQPIASTSSAQGRAVKPLQRSTARAVSESVATR